MKRLVLIGCVLFSRLMIQSSEVAQADPPDLLRSYRFLPRHSTLEQTGGFAGVEIHYAVGGRFDDTGNDEDKHVFRVSMLRNIAKTGPYFHDGSVTTLAQAVQIMADVQLDVQLSQVDQEHIVKFLDALTGKVPAQFSAPPANDATADRTNIP